MTSVPATVADFDHGVVAEVLARHACNVTAAARDLGVPSTDLRRLLWAVPSLQDQAFEVSEARIDLAERNIGEALGSADARERLAASMFTLRNSHRARRRGWITSSSSVAELSVSAGPQPELVFRWREPGDGRDAEIARLEEEGKRVVTIGWGDPDDGATIERDGRRIRLPRYDDGRGDCVDGAVAAPTVLIEHEHEHAEAVRPEPEPEPAVLTEAAEAEAAEAEAAEAAAARYERERVDAWIRRGVIDYPLAFCFGCRKQVVAGQEWVDVSNGDANAGTRFHRACHEVWRGEREAAAREALGLTR